jgi:cytosine/adenosine deaminase-related metal-dependent hydrolase
LYLFRFIVVSYSDSSGGLRPFAASVINKYNKKGTFAVMLQFLSASTVYPVVTPPLINGVLALEEDGTVHSILTEDEARNRGIENIQFFPGALIPGLINTHCHLELSHLFKLIPEHTGLQGFVQQVIKHRGTAENRVMEAMKLADEEMYRNGIVAVGDISNLLVSKAVKAESKLYYHTFVEIMGFDPEQASAIMQRALAMKADFAPLKASVNPHAPYSVSRELFAEICRYSMEHENLISMHSQETRDENLFFEQKKGAFLKLYAFLGLDISFFKATGKSSLQSVLPQLPPGKALLVHNTVTNEADLEFAKSMHPDLFWCLCPNANLYIEDRLPQLQLLQKAGVKITLGTDSLASNHQLSILAEMKTLQDAFEEPSSGGPSSGLQFPDLLKWATLNGAEFLGIERTYGSFEPEKKPGVVLIEALQNDRITKFTSVKRLL